MNKVDFLPCALPDIDDSEVDEVVDSLRSGWITTGVNDILSSNTK